MRNRYLPLPILVLTALCISGCVTEDNDSAINLGSVSIGDQLIDLKKARDSGAITGREYRELKADLLMLVNNAASGTGADERDSHSKDTHRQPRAPDPETDQEPEDDDSGFLF